MLYLSKRNEALKNDLEFILESILEYGARE